jgi:poly(3-hydroxybutyrate) depolymerase
MLYHWYELSHAAVRPARVAADAGRLFFRHPFNPLTHTPVGRHAAAACEVFERTTRRYGRPEYGIAHTKVDGAKVDVHEEVVWRRPFCRLLHFARDPAPEAQRSLPRLLLVAPMSGHFASLLRGTIETFLPTHDVYITDWQDAHTVPTSAGRFDLDTYIDYMIDIFRHFGGDVHVFAVCQPSVPVLAAVSLMEQWGDPDVPRTMVLAGGPIDTRVNPTVVNKLAQQRGTDWFRRNVITTVPWPSTGFGREVYPGFLQLTGFMTMNLDRHVDAHKDLFLHLVRGDGDSAEKHRAFYDEYLAVMDLTAEFYLQTIDTVFVRHLMATGQMTHRGHKIDLGAIRRVGLMTIEGEKDDITGLGQCAAAHRLCRSIPTRSKLHFECPDVGHYGIFNGSRFRREIATRIAQFVRAHDHRHPDAGAVGTTPTEAATDARVTAHDPAGAAFTFAPASPAQRGNGAHGAGDTAQGFGLLPIDLWAMVGRMVIDGMLGPHSAQGFDVPMRKIKRDF